jgi:protein MpaA
MATLKRTRKTSSRAVPQPAEHLLNPQVSVNVRRASALIEEAIEAGRPVALAELLAPMLIQARSSRRLRADALSVWESHGETLWLPRFQFQRTGVVKERHRFGIFAGIHGDEPAGILGLMDFLRELDETPDIGRNFELWLYPVCNPGGYLAGTRESRSGKDLNREFWRGSGEREVQLLEREIALRRFDGIIALHSDDSSPGFYGFARGDVLARQLLCPALEEAEKALPRDARPFIDGFKAVNGMIHESYDGILCAPPEQSPQPFELILESPAGAPLADQRRAFSLALKAVLSEYNSFTAYGAGI